MAKIVKFYKVELKNGFLSNWYLSDFIIDGIKFNSAEQYIMWRKAMLFYDINTADKILKEEKPSKMKNYGREIEGYIDEDWNVIRKKVTLKACLEKFKQNEELKEKLLEFDVNSIFVNCNPYEKVWGIGLRPDDPRTYYKSRWKGKNLLGDCLSRVRKELENDR